MSWVQPVPNILPCLSIKCISILGCCAITSPWDYIRLCNWAVCKHHLFLSLQGYYTLLMLTCLLFLKYAAAVFLRKGGCVWKRLKSYELAKIAATVDRTVLIWYNILGCSCLYSVRAKRQAAYCALIWWTFSRSQQFSFIEGYQNNALFDI